MTRCIPTGSGLGCEPHVPERVVAENPGTGRLQTPDLLGDAVDVVGVGPHQIAALLILNLLHLIPVGLRLCLVQLADRLGQERIP